MIRLFLDMLTLIPPAALVDAICTTLDAALRRPAETDQLGIVLAAEEINTSYLRRVMTPALRKALCALLTLGPDYASPALFSVLRYVVDSAEFEAVSTLDSKGLVRLCDSDEFGLVRRAALMLHAQQLLAAYSAVPFPKPNFPLDEECLFMRTRHAVIVEGASISFIDPLFPNSVWCFPSVNQVCFCCFSNLTPAA
jgi:hypothetical protein